MALADLMVVMDEGHIGRRALRAEIFERPASSLVARFIGGHNVVPANGGWSRSGRTAADSVRRVAVLPVGAGGCGRVSGALGAGRARNRIRRAGDGAAARQAVLSPARSPPGERATLVWSEEDVHALPNA